MTTVNTEELRKAFTVADQWSQKDEIDPREARAAFRAIAYLIYHAAAVGHAVELEEGK